MQTEEIRNQSVVMDDMEAFDAEADEIEDAIIKLSDYPNATLSLLSALADLHDRKARVLYSKAPTVPKQGETHSHTRRRLFLLLIIF